MNNPVTATVLALALSGAAIPVQAGAINIPAPDFTLESRSGDNVRLEDHRGEVVMLNFWASWCGPCRQEMPLMDDIYSRYQDLGFTILAVNVDENRDEALRFLDKVPVNYPILYDPESSVSELYEVPAMPTTVMIDRDGNARYIHYGYKPGYEDDYEAQIRELVRE
ncbi:thiol:disulfide interchange protein [Streptosporangium jomthongense]|uniref:TlpA family protein disulfide reductase n=1 Tax=Marinobacter aromaticivorans TaxID=1494078 RepID=A0ABW2ITV0_9GAMM|nr:TlpA disulfide reductase family protein [Marinobacter aromaticivorans]GGE59997.1 thiol:disulfide interchange protein [Streptosporangium jomthongense]